MTTNTAMNAFGFTQPDILRSLYLNQNPQSQSYYYDISNCAQTYLYYTQCLQEEAKMGLYLEPNMPQLHQQPESFQLQLPPMAMPQYNPNQTRDKVDFKTIVNERIEPLIEELSAFVASVIRKKVSDLIDREGDINANEKQLGEIIEINGKMLKEAKDAELSSQVITLNYIKYMKEKYQSSSNCLIGIIDNALESFFNKDTVEASFEKEIHEIMNNDIDNVDDLYKNLKKNTNSNQSTSNPSNSIKANERNDMRTDSDFLSLLHKDKANMFLSSLIIKKSSIESSMDSSSSGTEVDKTPSSLNSSNKKPYLESSGTKETRLQIEELILKRKVNGFNEHNRQCNNNNKITHHCIDCQKSFLIKQEFAWRTRCYYCQIEFKKNNTKDKSKANKGKGNNKNSNQTGNTKQVCIDCNKIFTVPIALVRRRRRCYVCFKAISEKN